MQRLSNGSKLTLVILGALIVVTFILRMRHPNATQSDQDQHNLGTMQVLEAATEGYEAESDDEYADMRVEGLDIYGYVTSEPSWTVVNQMTADELTSMLVQTDVPGQMLLFGYATTGTDKGAIEHVYAHLRQCEALYDINRVGNKTADSADDTESFATFRLTKTNVMYAIKLILTNWQGVPVVIGEANMYNQVSSMDDLLQESTLNNALSRLSLEDHFLPYEQGKISMVNIQPRADEDEDDE